jgi:hypothetical protein
LAETIGVHFLEEAIIGVFWLFSCGGYLTRVIFFIILGALSGKYGFLYCE